MKALAPIVCVSLLAFTSLCCRKAENPPPAKTTTPTQAAASHAATVINGLTGKTAVEQGQQAKAVIREVSAEKNTDLGEVYGK